MVLRFWPQQGSRCRGDPRNAIHMPDASEVIRDEPGACPICGMALEPLLPTDEPSEELVDFTRRMWISAVAAVPLVILTMGELVGLPVRDWLGHQLAIYIEFVLATPIVLWAAAPFFRRGWESIRNVSPNMWTLIALGVGAAYLYSLFATFLPGVFPAEYRMGESVGTYYEAAVVIITLIFVGQVLELRAREKTGDAIKALLDLAPRQPGASFQMAMNMRPPSKTSVKAIFCAFGLVTASRWMRRSSRDIQASMKA